MYVGSKEIYCIFMSCCIISVLFSAECYFCSNNFPIFLNKHGTKFKYQLGCVKIKQNKKSEWLLSVVMNIFCMVIYFWDFMQRLQLERVSLHDSKRGDYQHTKKVIEQLILLGEMDRAVQLLLETELESPNYYTDAIK